MSVNGFQGAYKLEISDQNLILLPQKAIFWKEKNTIIIADFHLGKTASFRLRGFALPGGTTTHDLKLLSGLIQNTGATEILFLGDFFHAKEGMTKQTFSATEEWRNKNSSIGITLVLGNHDRRTNQIAANLNIIVTDDLHELSPFYFSHKPVELKGEYVIAGHVHPAVRLAGPGKQREKLPCFFFRKNYAVLPSFGSFTGSYVIEPEVNDKVCVIADDEVVEVKQRNLIL